MKIATLRITAQSPLAFAERKPGTQFRASLPYVPGPALYGALGSLCYDPVRFLALRCHNAYPALASDAWVRPLPATAMRPKGGTVITDSLVGRVCWEQQKPSALIYAPTDEDGRPLMAARGFYTFDKGHVVTRRVDQRVLTRVAINRRRGTAEDQRLYSPLVLNEVTAGDSSRFLGTVVMDNDDDDTWRAFDFITHVGGRQQTGLGQIAVEVLRGDVEDGSAIADRVDMLTARFQEQARLFEALRGDHWSIHDRSIFTINLLAHALLLEHGWIPTTEFSAQALHNLTGIEARLVRTFATSTIVGGWHSLWQQPKPTSVATTMGSLFVFEATEPLDTHACAALARLQLDGIGDRKQEGYGQVRICDDFHFITPGGSDERA